VATKRYPLHPGREVFASYSHAKIGSTSKRRFDKMRKLWILACALALPCVASAQWDNINKLQAGQKIQVVEVNSKKDSGTFLSVSDQTISLQGKSGQQTIQRQDVASVKLMENKHRLRNALIGGAVGAGAGAGISAAAWEPRGFAGGRGTGAAFGAAVGFVGGAVVGAIWPSHELIYRTKGP
jgi:hypothetical protein